jgi:hypothetical protein
MAANLFNETGHNSIDARNTEAHSYIEELSSNTEPMAPQEKMFVENLFNMMENQTLSVSTKQLFWLRDLYQKYCC